MNEFNYYKQLFFYFCFVLKIVIIKIMQQYSILYFIAYLISIIITFVIFLKFNINSFIYL